MKTSGSGNPPATASKSEKGKSLKHLARDNSDYVILLFVALFLLTVPIWADYVSTFIMDAMIEAGIFAIVVIGLNVLFGYAGQISLGHAAFVGVGAYTTALLCTKITGFPTWFALILGGLLAGIIGLVIGIPVLRLKGHYLALATLAFGLIFTELLKTQNSVSNQSNGGIGGIPNFSVFGLTLKSKIMSSTGYYLLIWTIALLVVLFTINLIRSRVGRGLRALHSSDIAADTMGVNTRNYKVKVFVISAVLAGLCGGLWALSSGRIEASMFDLRYSILFVTMVVIGGMGNIWGGMMGAIALTFITKILELQIPQWFPTRPSWLADPGNIAVVLYGLLLILFMLFLPKGITFGLSRLGTISRRGGSRVKDRLRAIRYRGG